MDFEECLLLYCSSPTGNDLYSATSINFLGSEPVILRSSGLVALRSDFKKIWLNGEFFLTKMDISKNHSAQNSTLFFMLDVFIYCVFPFFFYFRAKLCFHGHCWREC